jgi:protein required for attachment to host cells
MRRTWVVVCDASVARLFQAEPEPRDWHLLDELTHRESRLKGRDLQSEPRGGIQQNDGSYRNAMEPLSLKKVEEDRFAKQIISVLGEGAAANAFEEFVLVAPPEFLGVLKKNLTPALSKRLKGTLNKDYSHLKPAELAEHLLD